MKKLTQFNEVPTSTPGAFLTFRLTVTGAESQEDSDTTLVFICSGIPQGPSSHTLPPGYFPEMLHLGTTPDDRITWPGPSIYMDYLASFGGEANVNPSPGNAYDFSGTNISTTENPMVWTAHAPEGGRWLDRYGDSEGLEYFVMYYHVDIISPEEREARFHFRHDDEIRCWNNGVLVLARDSWDEGQERFQDFTLHAGTNSMTLKLREGGGGNYLAVRITDREDNDYPDLQYMSHHHFKADAGPDQIGTKNQTVTLDGSGTTNAEGYFWEQIDGPSVELSNPNSVTPTFTAPEVPDGTVLVFRLTAASPEGFDRDTTNVHVYYGSQELPPGFFAQDIGNPLPGFTVYDETNDTYTITANGHDIWDTADDFRFVYTGIEGDFSASVRVDGPVGTWPHLWTKAGIMARESADSDSPHVNLVATLDNGIAFHWRRDRGAVSEYNGPAPPPPPPYPVYVGIQRQGDAFYGWYSTDGVNWTHRKEDMVTIQIGEAILVGMCVTSHDSSRLATARFSEFSTSACFPPVANAGPDAAGCLGDTVFLDGSSSLNAGSYFWEQVIMGSEPAVSIVDPNNTVASFVAPYEPPGTVLTFQLTVRDSEGENPDSDMVQVFISDPLPEGFENVDIGSPLPGMTTYDETSGTFTLLAAGTDIWGTHDEFRYTYLEAPAGIGHFELSVRVDGPPPGETWANAWTKAGIMVRQDLDPDSASMQLIASRDNGIVQQYRTAKGESAARQGGEGAKQPYEDGTLNFVGPVWLKLERQWDLFVGYYSYDGTEWVRGPLWAYPAHHTIVFEEPFYVGICLTSHNAGAATKAVFAFQPLTATRAVAEDGASMPGDTVTLDGSSSVNADSYEWTQVGGPEVVLSTEPGSPIATFTAPTAEDRTLLVFELTATGPLGTDTRTVSVLISDNLAFRSDTTPIARVTNPIGPGLKDVDVVRDGRRIQNYTSYDGDNAAAEDWYGFVWSEPVRVESLVYYQGEIYWEGGWWTNLTVQYTLDATTWLDAQDVVIEPTYDFSELASAKVAFRRYLLTFDPVDALGVRIYGEPGGPYGFTSIGELEAYSYIPTPPPQNRINEAVEAGLAYLRDLQNENGS